MIFRPSIMFPFAIVLTAINVGGAGFAAGAAEPWHATIHASLAVGFGLWAQRLRSRLRPARAEPVSEALEALQGEVSQLRQELTEAQERLDFTERLLAQSAEARRLGLER